MIVALNKEVTTRTSKECIMKWLERKRKLKTRMKLQYTKVNYRKVKCENWNTRNRKYTKWKSNLGMLLRLKYERERERMNHMETIFPSLSRTWNKILILGNNWGYVRTHRHMRLDASQVARNLMMMDSRLEDLLTSCRVTASRPDVKAYASRHMNSVGSFWSSLECASGRMSSCIRTCE